MRAALLAALVALPSARAAARAQGEPAYAVSLRPAAPPKGAAAWLLVRRDSSSTRDSIVGVEGDAAGERLHFRRSGQGWAALAASPIDGPDALEVAVRVAHREGTDTIRVSFPLAEPALPEERLMVAPTMAAFDSATAARVERELARSRAISAGAHDTPRQWRAFRVPRRSRITSVFGTPRAFNGEIFSRHLGTDFAGAVGAPVVAAARGIVALVADFYLAGHAVYLDHGGGLMTGYFHLSRVEVTAGDTVAAGQPIGRVGRSGRVTGPHLHWIARYGAVTIDPMSLVGLPAVP